MATRTELGKQTATQASMPGGVRLVLGLAVAAVMAGALYLISVRGDALLLDLSAFSQRIFCF